MATRWVAVDDTSADINYIGNSWFGNVGSRDFVGYYGPPFLSTLHGTNTSASFSFNFTGSRVRVMGSNQILNDSGVIDPQWSCYVDGVGMDTGPPYLYPENNWPFCSADNITDGPHTLTVNASVARNQTFWLDRIDYVPSTSVSLANKTIVLRSIDPAIQYGSGWNNYANIGNWTQRQNALVALNFYGTSLSWYGHIPSEWNGNATTAKWSIDEEAAQAFVLKGHETSAITVWNQKFFETPVYPLGPHTLTVTYNGNGQTPLLLAFLAIQNDTVSNSTTGSQSSSSNETPTIIGGVIGGVACLLILILFVLYRRRRRRRNRESQIISDEPPEYVPASQVFPYGPPSRLPAKALDVYSGSSNPHILGYHPPSGPSSINTPESRNLLGIATAAGGHSRKPSDSDIVSDTTGQVAAGPSEFLVRVSIPPVYTP